MSLWKANLGCMQAHCWFIINRKAVKILLKNPLYRFCLLLADFFIIFLKASFITTSVISRIKDIAQKLFYKIPQTSSVNNNVKSSTTLPIKSLNSNWNDVHCPKWALSVFPRISVTHFHWLCLHKIN